MMQQLGLEGQMGLALARIKGKEALKSFGERAQGWHAHLAMCSLTESPKEGLQMLRQEPKCRAVAEGWLALLKHDIPRALVSFEEAKSTPYAAKVGQGICACHLHEESSAEQLLGHLRPFAGRRFPVLAKAMGWENGLLHVSATDISTGKSIDQVVKKVSNSRVKHANLAELESVRIVADEQQDDYEDENDLDYEIVEGGFEETQSILSEQVTVVSEDSQNLFAKAKGLLESGELNETEAKELSIELENAKAGDTAAHQRLNNLIYFLK